MEGRSWGGNLEILSWLLMADREIPADLSVYDGGVLVLETSEEMPSAQEVFRMLRNMGERGLLRRFPALLMGRPKTWSFGRSPGRGGAVRSVSSGRRSCARWRRTRRRRWPSSTSTSGTPILSWSCRTAGRYASTARPAGITVTY